MRAKIFADDYQRRRAGLLGLPEDASDLEVHTHISEGVPHAHLVKLLREGEIDDVVCYQIAQGTSLWIRLAVTMVGGTALTDSRLSAIESDRFCRIVHALVVAESLFGSRDKARRWLSKPMVRFSGSSPMELLSSTAGAGLVEELLVQLADGLVL